MVRADLEAARQGWIDEAKHSAEERSRREESDYLCYVDAAGRVADFHALRHTYITNLATAGVSPKTAQTLARHSTITLTMDRYTHLGVVRTGSWLWSYSSGTSFRINYSAVPIADDPHLRVWYSWTWTGSSEPQSADYPISLTTTYPRFGGLRWWFICPLVADGRPCRNRVGKLYLPSRAHYFGCRQCYDLSYTSRQESRKYDSMYRMLAARMGMAQSPCGARCRESGSSVNESVRWAD